MLLEQFTSQYNPLCTQLCICLHPHPIMANDSEKQLKAFVNFNLIKVTAIKLKTQGDHVSIREQKAIYLVEVTKEDKPFLFGGIREKYFDKVVRKFKLSNATKHTKNCIEIM